MLGAELCSRFVCRPAICYFKSSAPDIVGIVVSSAKVSNYVVVPLEFADTEIVHPILVTDLPYSLIIDTDILRPHGVSVIVMF